MRKFLSSFLRSCECVNNFMKKFAYSCDLKFLHPVSDCCVNARKIFLRYICGCFKKFACSCDLKFLRPVSDCCVNVRKIFLRYICECVKKFAYSCCYCCVNLCERFNNFSCCMNDHIKYIIPALILLINISSSNAANFIELRVPCEIDTEVIAIMPAGERISLGKVIMTPVKSNWPAYTASKWCEPSTVCASAVNAIHMLIDVEEDHGRVISLVPKVTVAPAAAQGAFFALDMPAGTGIFGGFAPFVGSRVYIEHDGVESPLNRVPEKGDTLIIRTDLPENQKIFMVEIENRQGGRVTAWSDSGCKLIARVVRPLKGVGEFGGSLFQNVSRIRASHAGVIDIATSKRGELGGFQIMPLKHALTSKEMIYAWGSTQWMIISPLPGNRDLEGTEPLYKHSLLPGSQLNDSLPGLLTNYGRKPLVLCRLDGGNWQKLPEISGRVDDGLKNLTHLRIYYPAWEVF